MDKLISKRSSFLDELEPAILVTDVVASEPYVGDWKENPEVLEILAPLTEEQNIAAVTILDYMLSTAVGGYDMMVLAGYAGTGKTFTIDRITKVLKLLRRKDVLANTAPVNKAVKVLKNAALKSGNDTSYYMTVHKMLRLKPQVQNDGTVKFVQDKDPVFSIPIDRVRRLICDEASMLNDELFAPKDGVGLYTYVMNNGLKVVFVGDEGQIPPVKTDKHKSVEAIPFDESKRKKYNIGIVRLKTIMRQAAESPIISTATVVRNRKTCEDALISRKTKIVDGSGVVFMSGLAEVKKLCTQLFTDGNFEKNPDYARVIAWRNVTVDKMNQIIREIIYKKKCDKVEMGERLVARKPIFDPEDKTQILFTTNDEFEVVGIEIDCRIFEGTELRYYLVDVKNEEASARFRIIHEDSQKEFDGIVKGLKEIALARQKQGLGAQAWKRMYEFIELFAEVNYGYAGTVHTAQGSEFENVVVIESDIDLNRDIVERNRIKYTAITRGRKMVYIVN